MRQEGENNRQIDEERLEIEQAINGDVLDNVQNRYWVGSTEEYMALRWYWYLSEISLHDSQDGDIGCFGVSCMLTLQIYFQFNP